MAAAPIINPTVDEPKQHLEIQSGVLFPKSDLGGRTIRVLNLNDKKRVIDHRNELSSKAALLIHEMQDDVKTHKDSIDEHLRYGLRNRMQEMLDMTMPDMEYSAIVATAIFACKQYKELRDLLIELHAWDEDLEALHRRPHRGDS